jgi:Na(+)-translocating NADH:ubiquinone oxidoreductase B subunit
VKAVRRVFERLREKTAEGGPLRPVKPLIDATDHFFFGPDTRTEAASHVRDPLDVKRYMSMVIVALVPCVAASLYFFGLRVLALIAVSYAAGGAVEVLFACLRRHEINEGFLVTGLLFPLVLPPATPLWVVAVGVAFGVVIGKELFGGTGRNLFNPALVGRCFLAIAYPKALGSGWVSPGTGPLGRLGEWVGPGAVDAMTSATPLAAAKQGSLAPMTDLLWGHVAGSAGETSAIAIALGAVVLLATRIANWRTVVGVLGSFLALAAALHAAWPAHFGPPGWHLLAGGLLFGAVFMATDPVTSPVTAGGKWAAAVLIGVSAVLIRNLTGYVEGVMFAILLGNIAAPILDEVVVAFRVRRLVRVG